MGMSDYRKAKALIHDNEEDADFVGPRSEELVRKAEETLQVLFPRSYRQFLLDFGAGEIAGEEFYGIVEDDFVDSSVPDAIWSTLRLRKKIGLAHDLVVIGDSGAGEFYCLEIEPDGREGRVVTIDPANVSQRKKEAKNFGVFFLDRIEEVADED